MVARAHVNFVIRETHFSSSITCRLSMPLSCHFCSILFFFFFFNLLLWLSLFLLCRKCVIKWRLLFAYDLSRFSNQIKLSTIFFFVIVQMTSKMGKWEWNECDNLTNVRRNEQRRIGTALKWSESNAANEYTQFLGYKFRWRWYFESIAANSRG